MKRRIFTVVLASVLVALMLPGVATAKDKGKSVCKKGGWMELVDADGEPFTSQGACVQFATQGGAPMPSEAVLAVAYTDMVDDGGGYDPVVDVLIAKLVDTNGDEVVSVGDTVVTGEYPKDFDYGTAGFGSFGVTSHPVTGLFPSTGEFAVLSGGVDKFFIWHKTSEGEVYSEYDRNNAPTTFTQIEDGFTESLRFVDAIVVNSTSPSMPADNLSKSRVQISDDGFLDIDLITP